ncbi:MAG: hypothetical protein IPG79_14835 [Saprospiraceae bacterium]|nr:hypothetical protein [Saprospiraceae bacterium]
MINQKNSEEHINVLIDPLLNEIITKFASDKNLKPIHDGLLSLKRLNEEIKFQNNVIASKLKTGLKIFKNEYIA